LIRVAALAALAIFVLAALFGVATSSVKPKQSFTGRQADDGLNTVLGVQVTRDEGFT